MSSVKKIAEIANVSVATVSRVMHDSDKVKPETRLRVNEAMKLLSVDPNNLIRGNKNGHNVIGVIIPDLSNNFFTEAISGIQEIARELDFSLFICDTQGSEQKEIQYLQLLKRMSVSGLIITPVSDDHSSANDQYLQLLEMMEVPIVLLDRDIKYSNYDGVFIDNVQGAYEATRSLLENGHTRIAIITGPQNTNSGRERLQGYIDAFAAAGEKVDKNLIYYGDFSLESGKRLTKEIIDKHSDVTAIFTNNNLMMLGCLDTLTHAGKKVPEDISIFGFDKIGILEMLDINISVVDMPTYEMGRQSMKLMIKSVKHESKGFPRRITLMPRLVLKGSEKRRDIN